MPVPSLSDIVRSSSSTSAFLSGGAGPSWVSTTVSIPRFPVSPGHSVTITDAAVTPTSTILVHWGPYDDADENTPCFSGVSLAVRSRSSGSFVLELFAFDGKSDVGGNFKIIYQVI